jgi:hypothetical protein
VPIRYCIAVVIVCSVPVEIQPSRCLAHSRGRGCRILLMLKLTDWMHNEGIDARNSLANMTAWQI